MEPSQQVTAALTGSRFASLFPSGTVTPVPFSPIYVVAAGKAAWPMAHAFADCAGDRIRGGVIAGPRTRPGAIAPSFEWFDAGHPSPNADSVGAGDRALALAHAARADVDAQFVLLLSGGASALLVAPAEGISLADKIATGRALMRAGVAIDGLNCVRKHLSAIKGGQLGAAAGRSITLAISDVHGPIADDPSVIGSGPTVADPTTFADALGVVRDVAEVPASVRARLERGARGEHAETIKPGDPRLTDAVYAVIAHRQTALAGARRAAETLGYAVTVIDEAIDGEARDAGRALVARAQATGARDGRPRCLLAAGETTVTVTGDGLGGRNQELALAAAQALAALGRDAVLGSAGTDGIDGPTDAAGALVDGLTLQRARAAGLDWESTLSRNDAYHFFEALGDLLRWGPTGTNVGDVQVVLIA